MKKTFVSYYDRYEYCDGMSDKQKANLFDCIWSYPVATSRIEPLPEIQFVWNKIKKQLDRHNEEYEKICIRNKENADKRRKGKGGTSKSPDVPVASSGYQSMLDTDTDTDTDTVNGNDSKDITLSKDKEEVKPSYGNNDVNLCLDIITEVNDGIIDGTIKKNRQVAHNLIKKIKKIKKVIEGKKTRDVYLLDLLKVVKTSKYDMRKISSPEKIYYALAELQLVANQKATEIIKGPGEWIREDKTQTERFKEVEKYSENYGEELKQIYGDEFGKMLKTKYKEHLRSLRQ